MLHVLAVTISLWEEGSGHCAICSGCGHLTSGRGGWSLVSCLEVKFYVLVVAVSLAAEGAGHLASHLVIGSGCIHLTRGRESWSLGWSFSYRIWMRPPHKGRRELVT